MDGADRERIELSALRGQRSALAFVVGACLMGFTAFGQDSDVMTPGHVADLRQVTAIAISADGTRSAHVVSVPRRLADEDDGAAWAELHIVDRDGASRPYVTGEVNVSRIAWRPGTSEVSFLAKRGDDEAKALYLISADGGEARRRVRLAGGIVDYAWSPDGRRVALTGAGEEPEERTKLADKGFDQKVVEEQLRPVRLWLADVGDEAGETIEPQALEVEGSLRGVVWSPLGDRLAIKVSPTPLIDDGLIATRVRVLDTSGAEIARIANPGKIGEVAWSPDGERLAMVSAADENDPREGRLMVVDGDGGELREVLSEHLGHVTAVAWRDSERLVFLALEGVEARVAEISADGSDERTLLATGGPAWDDIDLAESGDLALLGSTAGHPDEVFRLAANADGGAQRLTDVNPWLAELRLAPQEIVTYTARDGLRLEGILIRPLDEEEGKRYPLILTVHGGPEAHYQNGWQTSYSRLGQVAAARGFAVFYPNYRASTGRGVAFSKLDHADSAGKEFDDLVDGVDHLISTGLVDRDKVGVTGGSYGGYATAWCSTFYSERFAAGVMFVGISNKISKFGTSDIPNELYQVHERKWPWEDWQYALDRSPLYHVEKARTPLLILHGEKDTRVFPGQSMELYRYLKTLGKVPVRLVLYPDEGHGNRRAASRYDYNLRALRWMEHYLQGSGGEPPPPEVDYGLEVDEEDAEEVASAT